MRLKSLIGVVLVGLIGLAVLGSAKVTIDYASWWFLEPGRAEVLKEIIQDFEAANPDIQVRIIEIPYAQYVSKLVTEFEAGAGPDVFTIQHESLIPWIARGYLQELNQYFSTEELAQYDAVFIAFYNEAKVGESVYAFPFEFVNYAGLIYNKRVLENAGIAFPPRTPEELLAASEQVVKSGAAPMGLIYFIDPANPTYLVGGGLMRALFGFNARIADERGVFKVNSPEFIAAVRFMKAIYDSPGTPIMPMGQQREAFNQGLAAMTIDGPYYMSIIRHANPEGYEDFAVAPLPFPHRYHKAECNFHGVNVNSSPEEKAAAIRFLEFLSSRETEVKWAIASCVGPARKDAGVDILDIYPWYRTYFESAPYAVSPYVAGHEEDTIEIRNYIADPLTRVLLGQVGIEEAMNELQEELTSVFGS